MNIRPPRPSRPEKSRIPHARLFGRRLRALRNDVHIANLLKQNIELKALVHALAEKLLDGKSPREVREILRDVLPEQRRIYNETLSRQAIKEARNVDDLLVMLDEIRATGDSSTGNSSTDDPSTGDSPRDTTA